MHAFHLQQRTGGKIVLSLFGEQNARATISRAKVGRQSDSECILFLMFLRWTCFEIDRDFSLATIPNHE
jgi:hypothetical protein